MARIVTVYIKELRDYDRKSGDLFPADMSYIRWLKISEALAALGHHVDMAVPDSLVKVQYNSISFGKQNVGLVPLCKVKWDDYDVVKTLFHRGFDTLEFYGGATHPFIISKLGSVVGPRDMDGIYFYGKTREALYEKQEKIAQGSTYITVLSHTARELFADCFGRRDDILLVPGAAEKFVPPPGKNPYPEGDHLKCLFAGNVYTGYTQPEANAALVNKLNELGSLLSRMGARLYFLGPGDLSRLDRQFVTNLGVVAYDKSWDYFYAADVGAVVAAGPFMHNNESTKIYHYLRVGLPVVSESGFPNDNIIREAKLGSVVDNGNLAVMAEKIVEAAHNQGWDREYASNFILNNHTWDKRVETYDKIIKEEIANVSTNDYSPIANS